MQLVHASPRSRVSRTFAATQAFVIIARKSIKNPAGMRPFAFTSRHSSPSTTKEEDGAASSSPARTGHSVDFQTLSHPRVVPAMPFHPLLFLFPLLPPFHPSLKQKKKPDGFAPSPRVKRASEKGLKGTNECSTGDMFIFFFDFSCRALSDSAFD